LAQHSHRNANKLSVFWDGYGLDQKNSGILSHAKFLAKELVKQSIRPTIFGNQSCQQYFPDLIVSPLTSPTILPKILNSKIFWRKRIKQEIESFISQKNIIDSKIIIHGLSNINLPKSIRLSKNSSLEIKNIITIHDLIPLIEPKSVSKAYHYQFKYLLPLVMNEADAVIAVSEWTAQGLEKLFPQHKEKIKIIGNGFQNFDPEQELYQKPLLTGSKINALTISRYEVYKQFDLLVKILDQDHTGFCFTLVTNKNGVLWAEKEAAHLIKNGRLKVLTDVSESDLKKLYRSSDLLLHPSLYEGFCLPAAEALASGTPVVYLSGTALDETVGISVGVPIKADASVTEWVNGINFAANMKHTEKFHLNLKNHLNDVTTWNQTGKKLFELYQSI
jgi:glycosyltransferase involved in cell wall biosynthesis